MPYQQRRVVLDEEDFNIDPIYGEDVQELDRQRLYVTNIPPELSDDGVYNYFSECGKVKSVYVNRDHMKHFGLVEFACAADAQRACMTLNNTPPLNLRMRYSYKKNKNFSTSQNSGYNTQKWDNEDENAMMAARKQITGPSAWSGNSPVRGRAKQYFRHHEIDADFSDEENISMAGGDVEDVDEELGELTSRIQHLLKMKKTFNTARTVVASKGKCADAMKMKVVISQPVEHTETVQQHLQKPVQYERVIKCAENLTVQYRTPKFGLPELQNTIEDCVKEDKAGLNSPPEMLPSLCLVCDSEASTVCGGCRTAPYCSQSCQRSDWTARHAKLCHNLANNMQKTQKVTSPSSVRNSSERPGSEEKNASLNVSHQRIEKDEDSVPSSNFQRNSGQNSYQKRNNRTDGSFGNRRTYGNDSSANKSTDDSGKRGYTNKAGNRGLNPTQAPSRAPNHSSYQNKQQSDENSYEKKDFSAKEECWEQPEKTTSTVPQEASVTQTPISVHRQDKFLHKEPEKNIEVKQTIQPKPTAITPVPDKLAVPQKPAVLKPMALEERLSRPAVTADSVVVLTNVESPTRIFVRPADQQSSLAYESTLHSVAVHALTAHKLVEAPAQGSIVLAEFGPEEGVFYRAAVMRTNVAANKYKLEYLEYGNEDKGCLEKMRKIGAEFEPANLPVLVSRVVLAGFQDEKFNERAMEYLTQLKDSYTELVLTIPDGSKTAANGSKVNLTIESTKKCLLTEIGAVSSPLWKKLDVPENADAVLELPVMMLDSMEHVVIPEGPCTLQVLETVALEQGTFNCFHVDSDIAKKVLVELEEELMKYAEQSTLGRDPYMPRNLELCIAKYHEDGLWYRAVCLQAEPGCSEVTVLFLDYGNVVNVPMTDLRKMLPDFVTGKPAVASLATIEGFPENPSVDLITAIRKVLEVDGAGERVECQKAVFNGAGEYIVTIPEITKIIENMK